MYRFTKIRYDRNGNPRHVTSWLGYGFKTYEQAVIAARTLGGRKYHSKHCDGGIVFQAYAHELDDIATKLAELGATA